MTVRIWINRAGPLRANMIEMIRDNADAVKTAIYATRPGAKSYALDVADFYGDEPDNDVSDHEYGMWALEYCRTHRIDVMIPTTRMAALAARRKKFAENNTTVLCAANAAGSVLADSKTGMYGLADSWGVPVPMSFRVNSSVQFREAVFTVEDAGYAATVKTDSGWSADSFRVVVNGSRAWSPDISDITGPSRPVISMETYAQALSGAADQGRKVPELIVMPYLDGPEVSVDCLSTPQGAVVAAVGRRKEGALRLFSGNENEVELAREIASKFGLMYLSNIQFRKLDGRTVLLEVNPRPSAGIFHTMATGVNLPWEAVRLGLGFGPRPVVPDTKKAVTITTSVQEVSW